MSKIKMRCSQCGKSFKTANTKQLICPDCEEKQRRERAAKARGLPAASSAPAPTASTRVIPARPVVNKAPAPSQPKAHWLDKQQDVKVGAPEPTDRARPPKIDAPRPAQPAASARPASSATPPPGHRAPETQASHHHQSAAAPAVQTDGKDERPSGPMKKHAGERPRKEQKPGSAAARPKREPRAPTPPFSPTPEQVAAIEKRYLELAQPHEFDGIRTQIAEELAIPKMAVKRVISSLRQRETIPSWWELQTYHGSPEDLERIRAAYLPLLPTPAVGVHKEIATQLGLTPGVVYQAIKLIRTELNLPQYNPPAEHEATSLPSGSSVTGG